MNETPDRNYKNDAAEFAQSSDLATRGSTGEYAGGGPDDSSANHTPARGEQSWQNGIEQEAANAELDDVESQSADPGQTVVEDPRGRV